MLLICWIIILLVFVGLLNWGLVVIFTMLWEWWKTQKNKNIGDIRELKEDHHENDPQRNKNLDCESGIPQKSQNIDDELYCESMNTGGRE